MVTVCKYEQAGVLKHFLFNLQRIIFYGLIFILLISAHLLILAVTTRYYIKSCPCSISNLMPWVIDCFLVSVNISFINLGPCLEISAQILVRFFTIHSFDLFVKFSLNSDMLAFISETSSEFSSFLYFSKPFSRYSKCSSRRSIWLDFKGWSLSSSINSKSEKYSSWNDLIKGSSKIEFTFSYFFSKLVHKLK